MHRNLRYSVFAAVLSTIPVGMALYEFFLAPATAQGGVVIPPRLWYALCTLAPALLPLLSVFEGHHWPGGFAFGFVLLLSNAVLYGLCGFLIAFAMTRLGRENRAAFQHPGASH